MTKKEKKSLGCALCPVYPMRLTRRKKIALAVAIPLAVLLIVNARWVGYVTHLARHQFGVVFGKQPIAQLLAQKDLSPERRAQLAMVENIRRFTEERYAMQKSKSYETFYDLGRNALGYNITVVPEFSMKPVAFDFFPIGSFEYLGFFDKALADKWANGYRARGFDVHLSEIGGYSTLGWFDDPLYSTQLDWGEYPLARLLGHEIAHEKLYFKDDTTFSELMASFIERKLAADFMRNYRRPMPSDSELQLRRRRQAEFTEMIEETKQKLEALYQSPLPAPDKKQKKAELIAALKNQLENRKKDFAQIGAAQELLQLPEINNATLIQFHRYSATSKAFEGAFHMCETQKNVYTCWFEKIAALKPCSREQRKAWLETDGKFNGC